MVFFFILFLLGYCMKSVKKNSKSPFFFFFNFHFYGIILKVK